MTNTKNSQEEKKDRVNPVVVAAAGAVVGASVAIAGVVALKDEKNRERVKETLANVKDQAIAYIGGTQRQVQNKKDVVEDKLVEGKEKVKKIANATKTLYIDEAKDAKKVLEESS